MPCYLEQRVSVKLRAENKEILIAALRAAKDEITGVSVYGDTLEAQSAKHGLFAIRMSGDALEVAADRSGESQSVAAEINRAYAREVVRTQAKRFGWNLMPTKAGFRATKRAGMAALAGLAVLLAAGPALAHHEEIVMAAPMVAATYAYCAAMLGGAVFAVRRLVRRARGEEAIR